MNRVMNGSVARGRLGASRPSTRKARPTAARATATIRNAHGRPSELATRGADEPGDGGADVAHAVDAERDPAALGREPGVDERHPDRERRPTEPSSRPPRSSAG